MDITYNELLRIVNNDFRIGTILCQYEHNKDEALREILFRKSIEGDLKAIKMYQETPTKKPCSFCHIPKNANEANELRIRKEASESQNNINEWIENNKELYDSIPTLNGVDYD